MEIRQTITIAGDPDHVWAIASDPRAIGTWLPGLTSVRAEGPVRTWSTGDGRRLTERIVSRDDAERVLASVVTDATGRDGAHRSLLWVQGDAGRAHVGWTIEIDEASETPERVVEHAGSVARMCREGLESLRALVEGTT